jgi:hypothetical protein
VRIESLSPSKKEQERTNERSLSSGKGRSPLFSNPREYTLIDTSKCVKLAVFGVKLRCKVVECATRRLVHWGEQMGCLDYGTGLLLG